MPSAAPDLRDIKPPVELPGDHGALWWVLPALVVLAALAAYLLWRRRRRDAAPIPAAPPRPAGDVALAALEALWAELAAGRIGPQAYFYGISATLRAYVEARFGLNATDLTTSEIRARLVSAAELSPALGSELVELLELADLVKFARAEAQADLRERARAGARRLVEATTPAPAVAAGGGDGH